MAVKYQRNPASTIGAINNELQKIQVALEDAVSRTGTAPNQLEDTLDANSQRIINLPEPVTNTEPVRKADFDELGNKLRSDVYTAVRDAEDATDDAIAATNSANAAASNAYQAISDLESDGYAVINQIELDGESAIQSLRVVNAGSFEDGATLTARNEVLYYLAEQTCYRWDGALPKTVPPASTPASTGGVGVGAWVDVGDAALRSDLANPNKGAAIVARGVVAVDSISDLLALPPGQRKEGLRYLVRGYHAGSDTGGGEFVWDSGSTKTPDGGLVFAGTGSSGRWIRLVNGWVTPEMYGAKADGVTDDTMALSGAINSGLPVQLLEGTYLSSKLEIGKDRRLAQIKIIGLGPTVSIIKSASETESITIAPVEGDPFYTEVMLKGFSVDGAGTATEMIIHRCSNVKLSKFRCINHVSRNMVIDLAFQVYLSACRFTVYTATAPECALYIKTNALSIDGGTYFNTHQRGACVIIDDNGVFGTSMSVSIEKCVFEEYLDAIKFKDDISTRSINIEKNYFEASSAGTDAVPLRIKGGLHESVSFSDNTIEPTTAASAVIDNVDPRSVISIFRNVLHRPVLLFTEQYGPTGLNVFGLPAITMDYQTIQLRNADYNFDFTPGIIINNLIPLRNISVSKIRNPQGTTYNRVVGSTYIRTPYSPEGEPILQFGIPVSDPSYARGLAMTLKVSSQPYTRSETGQNSVEKEIHTVTAVVRRVNNINSGIEVQSVSTDTSVKSSITSQNDPDNSTFSIMGVNDPDINTTEWFVDFDIQAFR